MECQQNRAQYFESKYRAPQFQDSVSSSDNTSSELSEQLLIRDVIYAFQGINGTYVRYNESAGGYVV